MSICRVQFSHRSDDDCKLPKFKDFQDPLPSNYNAFKALFGFQGLSRSRKMDTFFMDFHEPVATRNTVEATVSKTGLGAGQKYTSQFGPPNSGLAWPSPLCLIKATIELLLVTNNFQIVNVHSPKRNVPLLAIL